MRSEEGRYYEEKGIYANALTSYLKQLTTIRDIKQAELQQCFLKEKCDIPAVCLASLAPFGCLEKLDGSVTDRELGRVSHV